MSAPAVAVNISGTFGALLIGGIVASIFSGIVTVQTVVYFKNYSHDVAILRVLVAAVWFLDFLHTIFVSMSLWDHLIAHFGDQARIDFIPWSLATTIALTAALTYLVHGFFIYRIHKLSLNNFFISVPLAILATEPQTFCSTVHVLVHFGIGVIIRARRPHHRISLLPLKEESKENVQHESRP